MTRSALRLAAVLALVSALLPGTALARELVHYQKNMAFGNTTERALANDILRRAPDTVTLQEVNGDNQAILDMLSEAYPAQKRCWFKGIGGVAVLSRWPLVKGSPRCLRGQGVAAIRVQMPEGPVWVMSVHMEVPGNGVQSEMARALDPELRAIDGPKIVAGDFNAFPFAGTLQQVVRAAGVARVGGMPGTYKLGGMMWIPIDGVFATGGDGSVETLPLLGSDHLGLLARFTMDFAR